MATIPSPWLLSDLNVASLAKPLFQAWPQSLFSFFLRKCDQTSPPLYLVFWLRGGSSETAHQALRSAGGPRCRAPSRGWVFACPCKKSHMGFCAFLRIPFLGWFEGNPNKSIIPTLTDPHVALTPNTFVLSGVRSTPDDQKRNNMYLE